MLDIRGTVRVFRPSWIVAGLKTLGDTMVSPHTAFAAVRDGEAGPLVPFIALILLLLVGQALQMPALHNVNYLDTVHSFGGAASLSAAQEQQAMGDLNPPLVQDAINITSIIVAHLIALVIGAATAALLLVFLGGTPRFKALWAMMLYVAVPALGLYYVCAGIVFAFAGPNAYLTYADLDRAIPSLLSFAPSMPESALSTALGAINPFTAWALFSYVAAATIVGRARRGPAIAIALVLTFGGVALRSLMGIVFGY